MLSSKIALILYSDHSFIVFWPDLIVLFWPGVINCYQNKQLIVAQKLADYADTFSQL